MEAAIELADAHCHPQDDAQNQDAILSVKATKIAVMGVREGDWSHVEQLYNLAPHKVIPCFGIHPWFAHQHALQPGTRGADIIEVPERQEMTQQVQQLLDSCPSATWEDRLRALLQQYPEATVGEFGLDRAAVIPGTKAQVSLQHQLQLTERHLRIAAEHRRPVSMHCVRGYGHLHDLLRRLGPGACPPRIMLHSFGGSVESVEQFTKGLPQGVGSRVYFSFSTVINGKQREKLLQRMAAVPDNRVLIESDQNTPLHIDSGLQEVVGLMAEAKGLPLQQAAELAMSNFKAFYGL